MEPFILMNNSNRYFVSENGVIYTVYPNGKTNYQVTENIAVLDFKVQILEMDGCVKGEYQLWNSLSELASVIDSKN